MRGMSNSCCASNTLWPSPSCEPMNISATTMITSASDTPLRRPTKRFQEHHIEQHAPARSAHDLGGQEPGLARIHHPIGHVEQDHQDGAEGRDRDFGFVANTEQHQEQRNIADAGVERKKSMTNSSER